MLAKFTKSPTDCASFDGKQKMYVGKSSWAADINSAGHRIAITDQQSPILHTEFNL